MKSAVVALDLGGTWLKGCSLDLGGESPVPRELKRIRNPLGSVHTANEFAEAVEGFCRSLAGERQIKAVVAATAGEVDAAGWRYICAGEHLGVMGKAPWVPLLEQLLSCPVTLINDAEAFLVGAANRHLVPDEGSVGALVIGTGLGYAMARDGRWWRPNRRLVHLGAISFPGGDYNRLLSAVDASERGVFSRKNRSLVEDYLEKLTHAVATAANLFHLDVVLLGGGGIDALNSLEVDLAILQEKVHMRLLPGMKSLEILPVTDGNLTILEGVLTMAQGNAVVENSRSKAAFRSLSTELDGGVSGIEKLPAAEIARLLANEEEEAAVRFTCQSRALAKGAEMIAGAIRQGGRVIYVGAGTSGRLGALDAVEIPCTFGLKKNRFVPVIAGGVSDASLEIEGQGEEDISAVPDMILLDVNAMDIVVGISASGTAFFVRSALSFARSRGAATLLLHESPVDCELADHLISLGSGAELVSGSTRMKAGTATKKALNILSTTAMILLGKVWDGEMIDLDCNNEKLRNRAVRILAKFRSISDERAKELLESNGFQLRKAMELP